MAALAKDAASLVYLRQYSAYLSADASCQRAPLASDGARRQRPKRYFHAAGADDIVGGTLRDKASRRDGIVYCLTSHVIPMARWLDVERRAQCRLSGAHLAVALTRRHASARHAEADYRTAMFFNRDEERSMP